jgi:phage terminase large subunit-like protein
MKFCEMHLTAPGGTLAGKPIKLAPFQENFFYSVFDNSAITRTAILSKARKNAKTAVIAMIVLCYLVGPEAVSQGIIVSGARSKKQSALIFRMCRNMLESSEKLRGTVKIIPSLKEIYGLQMNTHYSALSAEGKTAHGDGPLVAVLDECGQVDGPYDAFFEAIITSQGAWDNPILFMISTQAAKDNDFLSIYIDDAINSQNPRTVCHVYSADPECDLDDQEQWRKANPAYDYFFPKQELIDASQKAKRMPSFENSFRNLHLNQRIAVESPFVSKSVWLENGALPEPLLGKKVYAGLDLSAVSDLTGLVMVSEEGDVECRAWLPKEGLLEKSRDDRVPYDVWAREGHLQTTPGRAIEYEWVAHELRRVFLEYDVQQMNFDRYNMKFLRPWLEKVGFTKAELERFKEFGQGFVSMGPALRALETALLQKQLKHGNHPVLTMCAANAIVEMDAAGGRKFTKKRATGRIDLMVALAMAEDARSAHKKPENKEWSFHIV